MKAVRVVQHGAPTEALALEDLPVPEPGRGELRVAVSAASLNFGDIARCRGTVAAVMGQVPFKGRVVHAALLELVAAGAIRPVIGRRITMAEVGAALDDHEQRRTTGRTVVDVRAS